MTGRCESCGQRATPVREVLADQLMRVMPRRVPTKWDALDLADEAIAVLRSLGWSTLPESPDYRNP